MKTDAEAANAASGMIQPIDMLNSFAPHDGTLWGLLDSRATVRGDETFLVYEDRSLSWREFREQVRRAAHGLAEIGVKKGDRVAIMATNSDRYVILFFAVARIGAILVPVNPALTADEARYIIDHAGPVAVFGADATCDVLRTIHDGSKRKPHLVMIEGAAAGWARFDTLCVAASLGPDKIEASADDTALILYTSGTTGLPKGVMHAQRNIITAGEVFVERMYLQPAERMLCVLPFFHINALLYSLMGAAAAGATLIVVPRFTASRFWEIAEHSRATEVNIIAAVGQILARRPRSEFRPGHRIQKIYGAPISQDIYEIFREEFGVSVLIEGYGLTETPGVCSNPFSGPHRIGSMGMISQHPDRARQSASIRLIDENGNDVPDGTPGQLIVRTPIIMQGYYRDPEATASAFTGDWFLTGDIAIRSAEGFYTFVARQKDIIRRRGENISGAELDNVIGRHPDVVAAAAIAVPAELGEDEILVAVVRRPHSALEARDIRNWCAERLNASKWPRYVAFLESLPYTPSHRVAKHRLRNDPALRKLAIDLEASNRESAAG